MAEFDFQEILSAAEKVKNDPDPAATKRSTSSKPLHFESSDEDIPIKAQIIKYVNDKKLTYSDICNYCIDLENGDAVKGRRLGNNIISTLRKRHSLSIPTLMLLCEFLKLDILIVPRETDDESEDGGSKDGKETE